MKKSFLAISIMGMMVIIFQAESTQALTVTLLDETVIIDNPADGTADSFGSGGFAITSNALIDAPTMAFDFGSVSAVSSAILTLTANQIFAQSGDASINLFGYADDGVIQLSDYNLGTLIDTFNYTVPQTRNVDVTSIVNSVLVSSQFIGFRLSSIALVGSLPGASYTGVQFNTNYSLAVEVVPEPTTIVLFGIGLAGLAGVGARRRWEKKAVYKS